MTEITANLVKDLREQTGAGMMDCKRALQETGGDLEAARKLLREKGMAQAGKRAARTTNEGVVLQKIAESAATMVAVACESEPVSVNEGFKSFANDVLERVVTDVPGAVDSLEDARVELVAKLGENIVIRRSVPPVNRSMRPSDVPFCPPKSRASCVVFTPGVGIHAPRR